MDRRKKIWAASRIVTLAVAVGVAGAMLAACRSKDDAVGAAPSSRDGSTAEPASASASAHVTVVPRPLGSVVIEEIDAGPLASGIPVPLAKVEAALNASHRPPYDGPTGAVTGTVRMTGDLPTPAAEAR